MMRSVFYVLLAWVLTMSAAPAQAQDVAVKTNLLYDATASVNLGAEIGLAPKWTLDVSGDLNAWDVSDGKRWRHWMVQPEARYWFCDRFAGHFVGVHAHGGQYNVGGIDNDIKIFGTNFGIVSEGRVQGWFVGAGVAYGYAWVLGKHWNLEAELGVGWAYTEFDRFECEGCGRKVEQDRTHNYFGPTKLALNLVYVF